MTVFPTTVDRASFGVHELLCTGDFPTILTSVVVEVAVYSNFAGRNTWDGGEGGIRCLFIG